MTIWNSFQILVTFEWPAIRSQKGKNFSISSKCLLELNFYTINWSLKIHTAAVVLPPGHYSQDLVCITLVVLTRASAFCVASLILLTQLFKSSRLSAATSRVWTGWDESCWEWIVHTKGREFFPSLCTTGQIYGVTDDGRKRGNATESFVWEGSLLWGITTKHWSAIIELLKKKQETLIGMSVFLEQFLPVY